MECQRIDANLEKCNCSYNPCDKKGKCCECLSYHWRMKQLPACLFPSDIEKTYDRSLKRFISIYQDSV